MTTKVVIDGISREKFEAYEKVRQSGVTNMFNISMVSELSYPHLTMVEIRYIMENYEQLMKTFADVRNTVYPNTIGLVNLEAHRVKE
jgi:hypothetical protein